MHECVKQPEKGLNVGDVRFTGVSPFDIGLAHSVHAQSSNGSVEFTLKVVLEGHGPNPKPVTVRMTKQVSGEAAVVLAHEAATSQKDL